MVQIGNRQKRAWLPASLCLLWTIWSERNRRAFKDVDISSLKSSFMRIFIDYVRHHIEGNTMSLIDFVDWLGAK